MKAIIYLRTSTEEQNPQNQLKDCLTLVKDEYLLVEEKQSSFKDKDRPEFEKIRKSIQNGSIKQLVVWDLDRVYRNRKKLIEFFQYCKIYKCEVLSFRQQWLNQLLDIPEPFNEMMHGLMLQVMGWIAEEESQKKSERVKLAVRKDTGITKSYKGKKWGRKNLSQSTIDEVIDLHKKGLSIRSIADEVFIWDKNRNKKNIAIGSVHKILTNFNKQH